MTKVVEKQGDREHAASSSVISSSAKKDACGNESQETIATDEKHLHEKKIPSNHQHPPKGRSTAITGDSQTRTPQQQSQSESLEATVATNKTIYVSNLHPRIAEVHLQKLFGAYGEVIRIHLVRKTIPKPNHFNPNISSRSGHQHSRAHSQKNTNMNIHMYAFVQYQTYQSAKNAIQKVHGKTLLGKELIVRYAHDRTSSDIHPTSSSITSSSTMATKRQTADGSGDADNARLLKKQKNDVQSKIESVRRALEESRQKRGTR